MASNTTELNIWVKLKDDATKALQGMEKTIDSLQPTFKKMSVVGVAGLGAIGAAAYKTIKDFGDADKAMQQLQHTTVNVAHGTMEQVKALSALADAEQKRGVLDADAIRTGQAQLMTFGLSVNMVEKLTQSMSDLAVNQFGVNAGAEDLTNTANIMAKALNGQFGILEKSGIRFTEAQRHLIQFGNETERTAALQEGLAQNLKFTNEVALKTFEGRMAKVNGLIGDFSENIGAALMPAVTRLLEGLVPVVEKIVAWAAENPKLIATVLAVGAGVSALVAGVGLLGLALPGIIAGFTALGTAFAAVFAFIAANPITLVVAGLIALYTASDTVRNAVNGMASAFKDFVTNSEAAQFILDTLKFAFEGVKQVILEQLWPALQNLWNTVSTLLIPAVQQLFTALTPLMPVLEFIGKAIGVVLLGGIWAVINALTAAILVITKVLEWITKLSEFGILVLTAYIRNLTDFISGMVDMFMKAVDWVEKLIKSIERLNVVKAAGSAISGLVSKVTGSKKANGGNVVGGNSYIVGERGPELLVPGFNGSIIPNHALAGGGVTVLIQNNKFVSPKEEARVMGNELVRYLKDNYSV